MNKRWRLGLYVLADFRELSARQTPNDTMLPSQLPFGLGKIPNAVFARCQASLMPHSASLSVQNSTDCTSFIPASVPASQQTFYHGIQLRKLKLRFGSNKCRLSCCCCCFFPAPGVWLKKRWRDWAACKMQECDALLWTEADTKKR